MEILKKCSENFFVKGVAMFLLLPGTSSAMQNELACKNLDHDLRCDRDICRRARSILKMANTTGFLRFV